MIAMTMNDDRHVESSPVPVDDGIDSDGDEHDTLTLTIYQMTMTLQCIIDVQFQPRQRPRSRFFVEPTVTIKL
jgi:hypothetical protein